MTDAEVEQFKREWRAAHPAIVKFWYAVDRAAWTAVRERGRVVRCGPVAFKSNGAFLQLKLPSGRKISYPQPRIVSGIARDILAEAMIRIEAAGYPIVLHVHDEIVAEVPLGTGSREEFTRLMTRRPAWALDLPIAASAWRDSRYTKGG